MKQASNGIGWRYVCQEDLEDFWGSVTVIQLVHILCALLLIQFFLFFYFNSTTIASNLLVVDVFMKARCHLLNLNKNI